MRRSRKLKLLKGTLAIIVFSGLVYFFWPNKIVTRCGVIYAGEQLRQSCSTCECRWGIPSGFNAPACFGGPITNCRAQ